MVAFRNEIKTTDCPNGCGNKVMTGRHQEFNARDKSGKIVCVECKVAELYGQTLDSPGQS